MAEDAETREAKHGKRMIEVRVRFWTNDLADGKGRICPRHAWGAGVVRLDPNDAHGIVGGEPVPFNSLAEIPAKVEKVAHRRRRDEHHNSTRMKRYHSPIVGEHERTSSRSS